MRHATALPPCSGPILILILILIRIRILTRIRAAAALEALAVKPS